MIHEDQIIETFYKYLNSDIDIIEFEQFVYQQKELEFKLAENVYFDLISFDFNEKYANENLRKLLLKQIVDEGSFETWKLKTVLQNFINQPNRTHENLNSLYELYCGSLKDDGQRKFEFKFLANLGLNVLYWIDEGYMKFSYGDNWMEDYKKAVIEVKFYHGQLKPLANEILEAIDAGKIIIFNDGSYKIENCLKNKLELGAIFKIAHP